MDRFRWLSEPNVPKVMPWDIDLTPEAMFATVPSKGAIVDGWLLTLPRYPVLNIASLPARERLSLLRQARETAICDSTSGRTTFIFEHGPVAAHGPTGCGVDHAHLHTVPLGFDLFSCLPEEMSWKTVRADDPWSDLGATDYLLIGSGDVWLACEPSTPESQFFRKRIAERQSSGYGWDHNEHYWSENVSRTIERFASGS